MPTRSRIERLVALVAAMKNGELPSAAKFAEQAPASLRVSRKTVQRDIHYLKRELQAPIDYDEHRHGYFLHDPSWTFPFEELQGHALWSMLLCGSISRGFLPSHLQSAADEVLKAQLAIAELNEFTADGLRAIVAATGARAPIAAGTFDTISQACRECRTVHLRYQASIGQPTRRDVDVHALFLAEGAWYARVNCHLRKAQRSLALHRIESAELSNKTFIRSEALVSAIRAGQIFDQELLESVSLRGSGEKARLLSEREWFPRQTVEHLPDGQVQLNYQKVPEDEILWWVLSYAGHLEVLAPDQLRRRVHEAARKIADAHAMEFYNPPPTTKTSTPDKQNGASRP